MSTDESGQLYELCVWTVRGCAVQPALWASTDLRAVDHVVSRLQSVKGKWPEWSRVTLHRRFPGLEKLLLDIDRLPAKTEPTETPPRREGQTT